MKGDAEQYHLFHKQKGLDINKTNPFCFSRYVI